MFNETERYRDTTDGLLTALGERVAVEFIQHFYYNLSKLVNSQKMFWNL